MKRWLVLLLLLLSCRVGHAMPLPWEALGQGSQFGLPVLESIEVEGAILADAQAIARASGLRPGDPLSARAFGEAIRGVYRLGFFEDVSLRLRRGQDGLILLVVVQEKPALCGARFEGNERLRTSDLEEAVTTERGSILDERRIRAAERRIVELYQERGLFLATVQHRLEPCGPGRVEVVYMIREARPVRIASVRFVGLETLSAEELLEVMEVRPQGYWMEEPFRAVIFGVARSVRVFDREKLATDLQRLRALLLEQGFLDHQVGQPVLELSTDRSRLYITIPLVEGPAYTVTEVRVSSDHEVLGEEAIRPLVRTSAQSPFRYSSLREDIERITLFFRDQGHAFANVDLLPRQRPDSAEVSVELRVQSGPEATIGRIEIVGNQLTRDRVIRRELEIFEGDRYSATAIERSRRFVQRLGFFETVQIREQPNRHDPTLVDLEIEVTERRTGSLQVGAGFSSYESFLLQGAVSHNNLFGRGQSLTFNMMFSSIRTLFSLSFYEPRLFQSNWQLSLQLFQRQEAYRDFDRSSRGFGTTVGYELTRDLTLALGYQLEEVRLRPGGQRGLSQVRYAPLFEDGITSQVSTSVTYDTRDNRLFPNRGFYHNARVEVADGLVGSQYEFIRLRLVSRAFASPLWPQWVFKLNAEFGYVGATNPNRPVPIFERFYVGGPNSVRGFERLSLSPTRPVARFEDPAATTFDYPVGGNKQILLNAELEWPLVRALQLRGVVFADAGNAFDNRERLSLRPDLLTPAAERGGNVLRTSAGFGIRWFSPIGPLRFEWGFPLARAPGERAMVFELSLMDSF
mgnify:CR=1 FL=1